MRIIAIKGPARSGKTTAASILASAAKHLGFTPRVYEISNPLKEAIPQEPGEAKDVYRKKLEDLGKVWRERYGSAVLVNKVLKKMERMQEDGTNFLIIPGVRGTEESSALHDAGAIVVQMQTLEKVRAARRDGPASKDETEEFANCGYCDHIVVNNDSMENLAKSMVDLLKGWVETWK